MGFTDLHNAAKNGDLKRVEEILKKSTEKLNEKDSGGCTPLLYASGDGHLEVVVKLVESGAIVNEKDNDGETPLHCASREGHLEVVVKLVESGAIVNEKNNYGDTPSDLASKKCHRNIVNFLDVSLLFIL